MSIHRLADEFKSKYQQLLVLVNNAGTYRTRRSETEDGIETHFAVNYLAPFLLTNLLLEDLKSSSPARVVNVAAMYHRKATINFNTLMYEQDYSEAKTHNQTKSALILFTYELALRLEGTEVTANCLHPGAVATSYTEKDPDASPLLLLFQKLFRPFFMKSIVRNYPLVAYFVIAYGNTWAIGFAIAASVQGWIDVKISPSVHFLTAFGPLLSAFIVTGLISGTNGTKELFGRMASRRTVDLYCPVQPCCSILDRNLDHARLER